MINREDIRDSLFPWLEIIGKICQNKKPRKIKSHGVINYLKRI